MVKSSGSPQEGRPKKKRSPSQKEGVENPLDFSSLDEEKLRFGAQKKEEAPLEFSSLHEDAFSSDRPDERMASKEYRSLYEKAAVYAEGVYEGKRNFEGKDRAHIEEAVGELINSAKDSTQGLLEFVFASPFESAHFYSLNLLNVCILSIEIGVGLSFTDEQLIQLGTAAFLHDIGQKRYVELIIQEREFSGDERSAVQAHALEGADMLHKCAPDISPLVIQSVEQEHERFDGMGYPRGLSGAQICEYAQIIGLCDIYEALTHKRPWRRQYPPSEALKLMIEQKKSFNPRILKVLLEQIGVYPRGTLVELNTHEVAQVLHQNFRMPCCPKVKVLFGQNKKRLERERIVDLSKGTTIYIVKSA